MLNDKKAFVETLTIVLIYTGLGILWILLSDSLLAGLVDDSVLLTQLQQVKGIVFVLATALLLYLLIRRMQKRLHLYDERYHELFHANPAPMWIHDQKTLKILLVNKAAEQHYGYSGREFRNLTIKDLRPAEDVPELLAWMESGSAQAEDVTRSGPWRHRTKDGRLIWVEIGRHAINHEGRPAMLVVARDVTASIEARDTLQLNAEVFENIREGIMVSDRDNRLVMVNRAFESITGYRSDEVIGKNPDVLSSGLQQPSFYETMWAALKHEGRWQGEIWNRRKDGSTYPQRLSISTIRDENGQIEKFIGIFSDASTERETEARLDFLANYDPLTGLPNRNSLLRDLEQALGQRRERHGELIVLDVDLDRFKHINDGLGYETGNRLLIEIAERLSRLVGNKGSVYRQSGDEFTLLFPDRSEQQAAHIAEEVLRVINDPFDADGQQVSFTASVGIAHFPHDGEAGEVLLQRADSALSRAKSAGRSAYQFFDESRQIQSLEFMRIENGLRHAIANDELFLHYQPQYDALNGEISGFEALVRWQHPQWGLISPGRFIPVAEESGQIVELGRWIVQEAVSEARSWYEGHGLRVPIAINISVIQFRREDFYEQVAKILETAGIPPELICFEITESVAMEDSEHSVSIIDRLHSLGISIAIDDFGSGYSSLNYLKRLKIDKLKIDQSFIRGVGNDGRDAAIVRSVIQLAHSLGFTTIAEGVELSEQREALCEMSCDEFQGFYFARPMATQNITSLLAGMNGRPSA